MDEPTLENPRSPELPAIVDWVVGAVVAVVGLAFLAGANLLGILVDRSMLVDRISTGAIEPAVLSRPDTIDVGREAVTWAGYGLVVSGLLLVVAGLVFVGTRRNWRTANRSAATSKRNVVTHAVAGAVTSALLAFLPFSPAIGGLASGYLEGGNARRSAGVGALAGLLVTAPLLLVLAFVGVGLVVGFLSVQAPGLALLAVVVLPLVLLVSATTSAALGALGGYVGGRIADDRV